MIGHPKIRPGDIAFTLPTDAALRHRDGEGWEQVADHRWHAVRMHYFAKPLGRVGDLAWGKPVREISVVAPGVSIEQTLTEQVTIECADTREVVLETVEVEESIRRLTSELRLAAGLPGQAAATAASEAVARLQTQLRSQQTSRRSTTATTSQTWSEQVTVTYTEPSHRTYLLPCYEKVAYELHLEFLDSLTVEYRRPSRLALRRRKFKIPAGPTTGAGHWTATNHNIMNFHSVLARIELWRPMVRSTVSASEGDARIGTVADPFEVSLLEIQDPARGGRCPTEDVQSLYQLTEGGAWPTKE
jgi:hypothetical protein